jgi:ABC-2 type transport system permease protein
MSAIAGWRSLVRLTIRRDRIRLGLWVTGVVGLVLVSTASVSSLYRTPAERATYARLVRSSAAVIVQSGPGFGLDDPTVGAIVMNETSIWVLILAGVLAILTVIRHTRAEEDDDRVALVRSTPVGRDAAAIAAGVTTSSVLVVIAVANGVGLVAFGLPVAGVVAFAAATVCTGLVFGALALVAAQVASTSRAAIGLSLAAVAVAFALRAIGDVGSGLLSWWSPIGWGQAVRPFADERWWVLLLPLVTTVALARVASALAARRDLGAGLRTPPAGRAVAGRHLSSPFALAMRVHRGMILAWVVATVLLGLLYGAIAGEAESMLSENPDLADFLAGFGGASITDAYLATAMTVIGLSAAGMVVAVVGRMHGEETAGRAELMLALPVSRQRWAWSHLGTAAVAMIAVLVAGGAATGITAALSLGDPGRVPQLVGAALLFAPATAVVAGLALLAYAALPHWTVLGWAAVALVGVVALFAEVLRLPQWMRDLSPYHHVPAAPAVSPGALPLVGLAALAAVVIGAALRQFGRRDVPRS